MVGLVNDNLELRQINSLYSILPKLAKIIFLIVAHVWLSNFWLSTHPCVEEQVSLVDYHLEPQMKIFRNFGKIWPKFHVLVKYCWNFMYHTTKYGKWGEKFGQPVDPHFSRAPPLDRRNSLFIIFVKNWFLEKDRKSVV